MDEVENGTPPILTFGQKAVGINFNPSGDPEVNRCKQQFANCIDQLHALSNKTNKVGEKNGEVGRMCSIAITTLQTAQMWAVKALTWKE